MTLDSDIDRLVTPISINRAKVESELGGGVDLSELENLCEATLPGDPESAHARAEILRRTAISPTRIIFDGSTDFESAVKECARIGFAAGKSEVELHFNGLIERIVSSESSEEVHGRFLRLMEQFLSEEGLFSPPESFQPHQQLALALALAQLTGEELCCEIRGHRFIAKPDLRQSEINPIHDAIINSQLVDLG